MSCSMCKTGLSHSASKCLNRLNNKFRYKAYPRIYVQYNDLVFSGMNSIETADLSGDYKISTTPYPFKHGSYYGGAIKQGRLLNGEQDLSLDVKLPFSYLTRLQVLDYANYIKYQLSKPGKIWAFDTGGVLIWAFAIPKHMPYDDYEIRDGKIVSYKLDLLLPDGVWHVADTSNVFLEPYDLCDMKDDFGTGKEHACNAVGACENEQCELCCDNITEDMNFCNTCWDPYSNCDYPYRIVYNCALGAEINSCDKWGESHMSQTNILAGKYISNGVIDSPVTITLVGEFKNPVLKWNNCTTIKIKGEFNGKLVLKGDGSVWYTPKNDCDLNYVLDGGKKQVSYDDIEYVDAQISFRAEHGDNYFIIYSETKPHTFNFAYISVDERLI